MRSLIFSPERWQWFAEDVIISKLEWFKSSDIDKHYFDALGIYRVQKEKLDLEYIDYWAKEKSIKEIWEKIKKAENKG